MQLHLIKSPKTNLRDSKGWEPLAKSGHENVEVAFELSEPKWWVDEDKGKLASIRPFCRSCVYLKKLGRIIYVKL